MLNGMEFQTVGLKVTESLTALEDQFSFVSLTDGHFSSGSHWAW